MKREIKIGKLSVEVREEIYKEYYKMKRRERYLEQDVKVGASIVDQETGAVIGYKPSKEDSLQRLLEKGKDFEDEHNVEEIAEEKAMLFILQEAMKELTRQEKELIDNLFNKNMSVRDVARKEKISHVALMKRRDKILEKLRKFF
jgi:DNA-directed RNA polymerase specialized sigma subunit